MRLFAYYVLHTFKNQVKKLFKSWVLILILVCVVVGIAGGLLSSLLTDPQEPVEEPIEDPAEDPGESFWDATGLTPGDVIELAAGGVALVILLFFTLSADKNGSRIFMPADVNLLFPSPMKPQSVLLFRLGTQLGLGLLGSLYMLFQVPNLTLNMGLSLWAALSLALAWGLTVAVGTLLQLTFYTLCATYPAVKRNLRRCVYLLLLLMVGGYLLYVQRSGQGYLRSAVGYFNGPVTRFIPFWGWIKGMCVCASQGNALGAVGFLLAVLAGGAALVAVIWNIKADFYEDAMSKSEETAEIIAAAQSENSGVVVRRKKDRSEKLRRDGLNHGYGADVFLYKALYNRFRFAHFHFLTGTMETYLAFTLLVAAICRFAAHTRSVIPVVLVLAVMVFFRSLGNPLEQDTRMDFFLLIPESTWSKLFWSLMGGTVCCLLDVLPAVLLGAVLVGANPLTALLWIPPIVSVDFYATCVGAFIFHSTPASAGKMIKQMVQVLFVYFGLIPDIPLAVLGGYLGHLYTGLAAACALNLGLGLVFFGLTPLFLDPREKKRPGGAVPGVDLKAAGKRFSRIGASAALIYVSATVFQLAAAAVAALIWPEGGNPGWVDWVCSFAPMYLIAMPLGLLLMRRVPADPPEKTPLRPGQYLTAGAVSIFLMYAGSILGTLILSLIGSLSGSTAENPLIGYVTDDSLLPRVLVMVILAPLFEEYVFRKQLIDRMRVYGEKLAVITSALMFGLFHGNLSQFFYAFALGLVFGYLYLRTGRLRWSTGLHMFINFLGGVVAPELLNSIDYEALESINILDTEAVMGVFSSILPFVVYGLVMMVLFVTGLVLFCINIRKTVFQPAPMELSPRQGLRRAWLNPGMAVFVLLCLASIVLTFIV